jgi:hypothetical protein
METFSLAYKKLLVKLLKLYKNTQIFKIALVVAILVVGYIASIFYNQMKVLTHQVGLITNSTETQLKLERYYRQLVCMSNLRRI